MTHIQCSRTNAEIITKDKIKDYAEIFIETEFMVYLNIKTEDNVLNNFDIEDKYCIITRKIRDDNLKTLKILISDLLSLRPVIYFSEILKEYTNINKLKNVIEIFIKLGVSFIINQNDILNLRANSDTKDILKNTTLIFNELNNKVNIRNELNDYNNKIIILIDKDSTYKVEEHMESIIESKDDLTTAFIDSFKLYIEILNDKYQPSYITNIEAINQITGLRLDKELNNIDINMCKEYLEKIKDKLKIQSIEDNVNEDYSYKINDIRANIEQIRQEIKSNAIDSQSEIETNERIKELINRLSQMLPNNKKNMTETPIELIENETKENQATDDNETMTESQLETIDIKIADKKIPIITEIIRTHEITDGLETIEEEMLIYTEQSDIDLSDEDQLLARQEIMNTDDGQMSFMKYIKNLLICAQNRADCINNDLKWTLALNGIHNHLKLIGFIFISLFVLGFALIINKRNKSK